MISLNVTLLLRCNVDEILEVKLVLLSPASLKGTELFDDIK